MTGGDDDHDHRGSSEPRFCNRRARPQILRRTTKQGSRYRYDPDRIVKALSEHPACQEDLALTRKKPSFELDLSSGVALRHQYRLLD